MGENKIKGYPDYTITSTGHVFRKGKEVKPYVNRDGGYKQVKLYKDGVRETKQVSRLVAGEPVGKDVDHKDNNKMNNISKNLQPMNHGDNVRKYYHEDQFKK